MASPLVGSQLACHRHCPHRRHRRYRDVADGVGVRGGRDHRVACRGGPRELGVACRRELDDRSYQYSIGSQVFTAHRQLLWS